MANSILRTLDYESKGFVAVGLLCLMMMMIQKGYAREFQVNWGLHSGSNAQTYNQWAEHNRFQIGDSLVFNYAPKEDSVLYVSEDAYKNCNVESPWSKYTDGHAVFLLDHSGPYHFISGTKGNCQKNEKLVVVVLADRTNRSSTANVTNAPSPAPSGSVDVMPSPAPSAESPPTGTVEVNPTPAPSEESHPPNVATSLRWMSTTMGTVLVASTLVLGF
ncbi:hypothetical protein V6Z12_D05G413100 [Gossypium hirsutum]